MNAPARKAVVCPHRVLMGAWWVLYVAVVSLVSVTVGFMLWMLLGESGVLAHVVPVAAAAVLAWMGGWSADDVVRRWGIARMVTLLYCDGECGRP